MLPYPFRGMGARTETQQSGHAPRSGSLIKDERKCQKWRAGESQIRGQCIKEVGYDF